MTQAWINVAYLVAAVLFIVGIKGLTHPRTAVRGNLMSALGMFIAVVATVPQLSPDGWIVVLAGIVVGGLVGVFLARRVQMTAMPQLVAIFNGLGGIASVLVAGAELLKPRMQVVGGVMTGVRAVTRETDYDSLIAIGATGVIGAVTFTGSLIAFAKLQEIRRFSNPVALPGQQLLSGLLLALSVALAAWLVANPGAIWAYWTLAILAGVLGVTLVLPIGGADMPVVVALLNSYSGLAAAATGFVLSNNVLIIAGSLVGASGLILTNIMCKAMNRSLVNVLFGKIDASSAVGTADEVYGGRIKSTTADEVAVLLADAQRVVIVPGYGMAVAQAQHAVRDIYNVLTDRGAEVEFAIHPVAGRMPGHMNVLLAEVDIPYDKLVEMEAANRTMATVDVVIVLGANDVVNPDARKADSPISGMPIIDVDKARTVVVVKRSLSPGFAAIPNPLFANDNTLMFFGDGKKAMMDLLTELNEM